MVRQTKGGEEHEVLKVRSGRSVTGGREGAVKLKNHETWTCCENVIKAQFREGETRKGERVSRSPAARDCRTL